ncbi:MAG: hypothetical protein K2N72_12580, partial [Oscillospiraceae bacterium]|nr:hypothetical protein [Oscillospiraceae bacterium]
YFLGWKKAGRTAEMLTWFIFINFFIWLFIIKHFILERFTLPIYIYTLISLPEVLEFYRTYCAELAEKLKNSKKERKKSKGKKFPEKYCKLKKYASNLLFPGVTAAALIVTFWYNIFCIGQGVHGVFPYKSIFYPLWINNGEVNARLEKNPHAIYVNLELMEFSYLMKSRDYTIVALINGSNGDNMEWAEKNNFRKAGMNEFLNCTNGESFVGVYSKGKSVFEKVSENERLSETISLYDGKYTVTAKSGGANAGAYASLTVNGIEFVSYPEKEGVFFAVFDNKTQKLKTAQGYVTTDYTCEYVVSNGFAGIYYNEGFEDLEPVYD